MGERATEGWNIRSSEREQIFEKKMEFFGQKKTRSPNLENEPIALFLCARGSTRVQYNVFKVISLSLRNNGNPPNLGC
jgi:uncharacterized protein YlaI